MTVLFQNQFHKNLFQRLWWDQDGAPYHGLLAVCPKLNQDFGERVSSLHNNTEWLPRSPDLISCDLFSLRLFKRQVFRTPQESLNVLQQIIITECNLLRENRDLIRRSVQHKRSRADTCIQGGRRLC